jgi:uncharacterized delta-60 repeat protein
MRGSLLITYEEGKQNFGLPLYEITINGTDTRDYQWSEASSLYSTYIFSGNTLTVRVGDYGYGQIPYINVYLSEYTNDAIGDDQGIKTIQLTGVTGNNTDGTLTLSNLSINPSANCYDFIVTISAGLTQGCAPFGVISGITGSGVIYTTTSEIQRKSIGTNVFNENDVYIGMRSDFTNSSYSGATAIGVIGPVFRVNSTYQLDTIFNSKTALGASYYQINDIELQNDSKPIIVGGQFFNSATTGYSLNRLTVNGNLDGTFIRYNFNGGPDSITDVSQQSDGKIVVSGAFTQINGSTYNRYARFNYDGTIDNTYYSGATGGFNAFVNCDMDSQDRAYFFGSSYTLFNSLAFGSIMRLTSTGALDTTFNVTGRGGFSLTANEAIVNSILILSNGKILCFGAFDKYNGQTCSKGVAMLNEDGTLDTTFNQGGVGFTYTGVTFTTYPTETLNQDENKFLIVGDFSGATYNGQSLPKDIFFLNSDGTLGDNTNLGTGIEGFPKTCKLLSNGSYIITGQLSGFNGTDINNGGLLQLSSSGQLQNC